MPEFIVTVDADEIGATAILWKPTAKVWADADGHWNSDSTEDGTGDIEGYVGGLAELLGVRPGGRGRVRIERVEEDK